MKKTIAFLMLLAAMPLLTSCLSSDDDDIVYYDDAAITSFAVTSVNQYIHTLSSEGKDSVYKRVLDGSLYKFYIDQQKCEIYNPDSLPYGSDVKHVLSTISSRYSGTVYIKSLISDTLFYYSSSDSIDFSQPRTVCAYSNSGQYFRPYTLRVNVHQEDGDEMKWAKLATNSALAALTGMRAAVAGDRLWVMGSDGSQSRLYYAGLADGASWTELSLDGTPSTEAWKNLTVWQGRPCYLDGQTCTVVELDDDGLPIGQSTYSDGSWPMLQRLAGSDGHRLYALDGDGMLWSSPEDLSSGEAWEPQLLDDVSSLLPVQDLHLLTLPLQTNADAQRLVLVGNRTEDTDQNGVVWGRVVEYDTNAEKQPWGYYEVAADNRYPVPHLTHMQVANYDSGLLAFGGDGLGASKAVAFDCFYLSVDGGITWQKDSLITLPDGFQSDKASFAMTSDSENYLWIVCGGSGQVWRGRLNRLGWKREETAFTE